MPWLIAIWGTVPPVPAIVLILMFPVLVGKISVVALALVPVGAVLAPIPVVIVVVPRVGDTGFDMFIVEHCSGDRTVGRLTGHLELPNSTRPVCGGFFLTAGSPR